MGIGKVLKGGLTGGLVGAAKAGNVSIGDIARNGGLGLVGMLAAKKRKEDLRPQISGGPVADDSTDRAMKKGGKISAAEAVHKHERAKHKGQPLTKMAKGGSASKRADGCATKGKTKGKFV